MTSHRALTITTVLSSIALVATSSAAHAARENESGDLLNLSLEELSNVQITSVSKRSEKASEAASAVYVITQEDIRRSGMTTIPELLRMVPGLNVAQSSSRQWAVSSRGLSGQFTDTLLVLIDGRSVYTPLYSGVYWDVQDTMLQDIERIEVIRGPGATLWGANAVNGVINIITKNTKDTVGGLASFTSGTHENGLATFRHGAKISDNAYARGYVKYDDHDSVRTMTDTDAHDAWNKAQAGFRADWKQDNGQSFTVQGDMYRAGESGILGLIQPAGTIIPSSIREINRGGNILGRWNNKISSVSDVSLQIYYDEARRSNFIYTSALETLDVDFQHVWSPLESHELVWGIGYRRVHSDFIGNAGTALGIPYIQLLPQSQADDLYSAFVQDKITLMPKDLFLTVGSKFEHNAFTGFEFQPSARLSWLVSETQTLWASASRAVRTPNIGSTNSLQQIVSPFSAGVFYAQVNNPNGKSEELNAYELGYRIQPQKNLSLDFSAFYNDYDRLIIGVFGTPYFEPVIGYGIIPVSPQNIGTAHTWGGEISAKWNPNSYTELSTGYTLLQMKFDQPDPVGYNFAGKTPHQQPNALATFQLPHNLELTAAAYYVGEMTAIDFNTGAGIPDYTRVDMRLGWKPMDNLELSIVGQNLLDDVHQEFGGFAYQASSQIPRSVYGNITWRF